MLARDLFVGVIFKTIGRVNFGFGASSLFS